jgi:GGDEF domain-containing protein
LSDALEQTFRDSYILARLGGDEFAVLAMEASSKPRSDSASLGRESEEIEREPISLRRVAQCPSGAVRSEASRLAWCTHCAS